MNKTLALLAFAVIGTTGAGFALAQTSGEASEKTHPHHASPAATAHKPMSADMPAGISPMHPMHGHMMQMHQHMMTMHTQMHPNGQMGQIGDMPCIEDAEAKPETR